MDNFVSEGSRIGSELFPDNYSQNSINLGDGGKIALKDLHGIFDNLLERNIVWSLFIIIIVGFVSLGVASYFTPKCDGDKSFSEFARASGTTALGALVAVLARKRSSS